MNYLMRLTQVLLVALVFIECVTVVGVAIVYIATGFNVFEQFDWINDDLPNYF